MALEQRTASRVASGRPRRAASGGIDAGIRVGAALQQDLGEARLPARADSRSGPPQEKTSSSSDSSRWRSSGSRPRSRSSVSISGRLRMTAAAHQPVLARRIRQRALRVARLQPFPSPSTIAAPPVIRAPCEVSSSFMAAALLGREVRAIDADQLQRRPVARLVRVDVGAVRDQPARNIEEEHERRLVQRRPAVALMPVNQPRHPLPGPQSPPPRRRWTQSPPTIGRGPATNAQSEAPRDVPRRRPPRAGVPATP